MPAVTPSTPQPLPRNLGGVCGYLPGKSRPYFYAQSTALDLLCQDLSSDPKNMYFYFIKYTIKVKNLGISSNFQSYFFVGLDQSHTRLWPKNMLTRRISVYLQNPQKRRKKKITIGPAIADFMQNQTLFQANFRKFLRRIWTSHTNFWDIKTCSRDVSRKNLKKLKISSP